MFFVCIYYEHMRELRSGFFGAAVWMIAIAQSGGAWQRAPLADNSGHGDLSPSVRATWSGHGPASHGPPPAGRWTLDLVVLWRGTPGWWLSAGMGGTTSDRSADGALKSIDHFVTFDGRTFTVRFDPQARTVRLGEEMLALGDRNVVLVDELDIARGPRIAGSVRVDPLFTDGPDGMERLLATSAEALGFLRCEAFAPGATAADTELLGMVALRCAQIRDGSAFTR